MNQAQRLRHYPISKKYFEREIEPIIQAHFSKAGRPQKISNYNVLCAVLYILCTGISWRDMPLCFGSWHAIFLRWQKWSDRNVIWHILRKMQQTRALTMDIVMIDSTTFKMHRHGGGQKGGSKPKGAVLQALESSSTL